MDNLSPRERSENMRRIRSKNTAPEKILAKVIRSLRYKFRSHVENLPGRPDFVFWNKSKVVFLHGCFWHCHGRCKIARIPKSKLKYWVPKLESNKQRDIRNKAKLRYGGWKVLTVWECELADLRGVRSRIKLFLRED